MERRITMGPGITKDLKDAFFASMAMIGHLKDDSQFDTADTVSWEVVDHEGDKFRVYVIPTD
jgi:hypothetical protein